MEYTKNKNQTDNNPAINNSYTCSFLESKKDEKNSVLGDLTLLFLKDLGFPIAYFYPKGIKNYKDSNMYFFYK